MKKSKANSTNTNARPVQTCLSKRVSGFDFSRRDSISGKYWHDSYAILDINRAVIGAASGGNEVWLKQIADTLGEKTPDYLVLHAFCPKALESVEKFMEKFPNAKIAATGRTFTVLKFYAPGSALNELYDRRLSLKTTTLSISAFISCGLSTRRRT